MTTYIFYSNYSDKTKSGILRGFFFPESPKNLLPKFLNEEFEHIKNSFSKLQYPNLSFTALNQKL